MVTGWEFLLWTVAVMVGGEELVCLRVMLSPVMGLVVDPPPMLWDFYFDVFRVLESFKTR